MDVLGVPKAILSCLCFSLILTPVIGYIVQAIIVGVPPWDDEPRWAIRQDPPFWFNAVLALFAILAVCAFCVFVPHCIRTRNEVAKASAYARLGLD